ncbi:MAG TPA: hypothetical protein VEJ20_04755 [Candidatus Eremiobacteraceae bacterium]|nr:hypothetical protein [Candidatus Eremiobacteraceae bacterium]
MIVAGLALAFTVGFAAGLRTFTAPAVISFWRHMPLWAGVFTAGAVLEDVLDKLPRTPSRLGPLGLILRCVSAAACAVVLVGGVAAAALGIVGALAGAYTGSGYRSIVGRARLPDWPFALLEDAAALGLALFTAHAARLLGG